MSRRQRISKAPAVRPAYTKILEQAIAVLYEDGFDRFNVQRVLDRAEVSRATLYRYFPDVDGLIEAALIEAFQREVDRYSKIVIDLIQNSPSLEVFRDSLRALVQAFSTLPAAVRLQRTHTIALAATRPELRASIASVQETLTDSWEATFTEAQQRGFARADVDTRAAAVIVQAMAIGRIVDDAAANPVSNERWAQTFFEFVDRTVLTQHT